MVRIMHKVIFECGCAHRKFCSHIRFNFTLCQMFGVLEIFDLWQVVSNRCKIHQNIYVGGFCTKSFIIGNM